MGGAIIYKGVLTTEDQIPVFTGTVESPENTTPISVKKKGKWTETQGYIVNYLDNTKAVVGKWTDNNDNKIYSGTWIVYKDDRTEDTINNFTGDWDEDNNNTNYVPTTKFSDGISIIGKQHIDIIINDDFINNCLCLDLYYIEKVDIQKKDDEVDIYTDISFCIKPNKIFEKFYNELVQLGYTDEKNKADELFTSKLIYSQLTWEKTKNDSLPIMKRLNNENIIFNKFIHQDPNGLYYYQPHSYDDYCFTKNFYILTGYYNINGNLQYVYLYFDVETIAEKVCIYIIDPEYNIDSDQRDIRNYDIIYKTKTIKKEKRKEGEITFNYKKPSKLLQFISVCFIFNNIIKLRHSEKDVSANNIFGEFMNRKGVGNLIISSNYNNITKKYDELNRDFFYFCIKLINDNTNNNIELTIHKKDTVCFKNTSYYHSVYYLFKYFIFKEDNTFKEYIDKIQKKILIIILKF